MHIAFYPHELTTGFLNHPLCGVGVRLEKGEGGPVNWPSVFNEVALPSEICRPHKTKNREQPWTGNRPRGS
jgi:hypothetical protein